MEENIMSAAYPIIDADGHVLEKDVELAEFLEGPYREMRRNETYGFFPPSTVGTAASPPPEKSPRCRRPAGWSSSTSSVSS